MIKKKVGYDEKIPVRLSLKERDLVFRETLCDSRLMRFGVVEGNTIKVGMTLGDVEEIHGFIAAAANHTGDERLQRELDRLVDKLQVVLDRYDEEAEVD